jgi:hypothetical protein
LQFGLARPARADSDPASLSEAKELFKRGVALLSSGDSERALEYFLHSRELVPSGKNTVNAAICLERLGRLDEALEMYEEVLARFSSDLDDDDRASLTPVMASLRERIGYLDLSSNVQGLVVVDGRPRGTLPLRVALRVLPGQRDVRIVKDGYRTFAGKVEIARAQTTKLDAELSPLAGKGVLRVESWGGQVVDVTLDGERVGETPWESVIPQGKHLLATARGELGSAPELVNLLEGKTILVRTRVEKMAPELRIASEPRDAELFLRDVPVGHGSWVGRLPYGEYRLRVSQSGYLDDVRALTVGPAGAQDVRVVLTRDPHSPLWPQPSRWRLQIGAGLGPLFVPTLSGGADSACPAACAGSRAAWGGFAEATVGPSHESGFGAELHAGYGFFHRSFARAVQAPYTDGVTPSVATYALRQTLDERGPFIGVRGRVRKRVGLGFYFFGTAGVGALFAQYSTAFAGSVWTNGPAFAARSSRVPSLSETAPFVSASLGAQRMIGRISLRASLGAWFFPVQGPRFQGPELGVPPNCSPSSAPGDVGCAPNTNQISGERVHGAFWALAPELGAETTF